jgi:hypothetical protein
MLCLYVTATNRIDGVNASVFSSSAVERVFAPRSGQIKENKIGISWFSAKHPARRSDIKDLLARNQDYV